MDWIYRLQERIAITKNESAALLAVTGLFLGGLAVQYVSGYTATLPEDYYAAVDSAFKARTQNLNSPPSAPGIVSSRDTSDNRKEDEAAPKERGARMNLNEATARQLEQLPGVGPVIADRIIEFRKQHGPFTRVAEIDQVSGIGPKTLADIAPFLFVEEPTKAKK